MRNAPLLSSSCKNNYSNWSFHASWNLMSSNEDCSPSGSWMSSLKKTTTQKGCCMTSCRMLI